MMFCPKCGSLLIPKREGTKTIVKCSCGHIADAASGKIGEVKRQDPNHKKIEIVHTEIETLPLTEAECPRCKHKQAYWWEVQTRAADEAPTKFLKCEKCKHQWRDYN